MACYMSASLPVTRDEEFYFPDGNIILAVGCGRPDATLFRVFMSQLSKHSEVLKDMSGMPRPDGNSGNAEEEIEGIPVVRMDDAVADIRTTFGLLWDITPDQPTAAEVMASLRISTKYEMPKIRDWSLHHLTTLFPPDSTQLLTKSSLNRYMEGHTAIDLIVTSYQCDTPAFLPLAFYAMATADWSDRQRMQKIGLHRLSQDQMMMLSAGRAYLQDKLATHLGTRYINPFDWLYVEADCADSGKSCFRRTRVNTWPPSSTALRDYASRADLISWINHSAEMGSDVGICEMCQQSWREQAGAKVEEVFRRFCSITEILNPNPRSS